MKILFLASEVTPFAKSGGLADVAGSLPHALRRLGHDIRIVLPGHAEITRRGHAPAPLPLAATVRDGTGTLPLQVRYCDHDGVLVYFIDHPDYFARDGLYAPPGGADYPDNALRFAFFCRAALELCRALDFAPDLCHGNDWQSGLLPALLASEYHSDRFFAETATLFTIHNLGYQGLFPAAAVDELALDRRLFHMEGLEYFDQLSMLKAGIVYSDVVTTVSDSYCREIQTPAYGHGFDGILRRRHNRLFGILNGIDPAEWDPAGLAPPYSGADLSGKGAHKAALQRELGLAADPAALLVGMVTRLDVQKGLDLIEQCWDELLTQPLQFVLLGSGDPGLAERFAARAATSPTRVAVSLRFDEGLARRIYAGSDLFLMPSRYEPCGLSQMIALRYGTLPLVRRTGGLADTIIDPLENRTLANGFSFSEAYPGALLATLDRALHAYRNPLLWQTLQRHAMAADSSWDHSARRYVEFYHLAREVRHERPVID